jgi:hypothetical protein
MNGTDGVLWRRRLIEHDIASYVTAAMGQGDDVAPTTAAMNEIDRQFASHPETCGESREDCERLLIVPPLAVAYEVHEEERVVDVLRGRLLPRHPTDD